VHEAFVKWKKNNYISYLWKKKQPIMKIITSKKQRLEDYYEARKDY
jgi:hypothetical protein